MVLSTSQSFTNDANEVIASVQGLFSVDLGTNGLFTAMLLSIFTAEVFGKLYKFDGLKIKMPEQVPSGVARSFEVLIPATITLLIVGCISEILLALTGNRITDLIFSLIQQPLTHVGGSLPGILIFALVSTCFWSVGLHGDNLIGGIVTPLTTALILENAAAVEAGLAAPNIVNFSFWRCFFATGGTGMVLALTLAVLIAGKREDNKAIAKVAFVPNLFNIGEIDMFGMPVVLNPVLIVPFILATLVSLVFGYAATAIGICPVMYINLPWTMPPFLYGWLASGGKLMGGICQLIAVALSTLVYLPFVFVYEKQQNAAEAKADEIETEESVVSTLLQNETR